MRRASFTLLGTGPLPVRVYLGPNSFRCDEYEQRLFTLCVSSMVSEATGNSAAALYALPLDRWGSLATVWCQLLVQKPRHLTMTSLASICVCTKQTAQRWTRAGHHSVTIRTASFNEQCGMVCSMARKGTCEYDQKVALQPGGWVRWSRDAEPRARGGNDLP